MAASCEVTIVGAGIVGVATAIYLQREGHKVTLVDRGAPGEATSQGNSGSLAPGSIIPLALPGTIRKVPRWILDPLGPLSLSVRQVPSLIPWLFHFYRACTPENAARSATAMRSLNRTCIDTYTDLLAAAGSADLLERGDNLTVFKSARGFESSGYSRKLRTDNGVEVVVLDEAAIRKIEPALSTDYRWGYSLPDSAYVRNPLRVVQTLAKHFVANGGALVTANVRDFVLGKAGAIAVVTETGTIPVDRLVIAAGIWSRDLARKIGLRVPMTSERGYHIQIPESGIRLQHQVADGESRFVATSMEGGMRIAGTSEFSRVDAPPNWARAEALVELAKGMLPGIKTDRYSRWTGHRPSTADSLPVIGRSPRYAQIFIASGHGHWGLMAAPATGQVIADLVAGRAPRIDIAPFRPDRFQA